MKKQTWIAVAAVAAAFGLGGYLLGGRKQQQEATRPDDPGEPRGRSEPTGAPRTRPGVVVAPAATPDGAPPIAPRAGEQPTGVARGQQGRESPEQRQRQLAILTDSYRTESADPRWAPGAASTIELVAGPKGVGLKVLAVECHTLTCRAEIAESGPPQVRDAKLEQLAIRLEGILPSVLVEKTVDAPDGKRLVVYISRIPPM